MSHRGLRIGGFGGFGGFKYIVSSDSNLREVRACGARGRKVVLFVFVRNYSRNCCAYIISDGRGLQFDVLQCLYGKCKFECVELL